MILPHWKMFLGQFVKSLSLKIFRNHLVKALSNIELALFWTGICIETLPEVPCHQFFYKCMIFFILIYWFEMSTKSIRGFLICKSRSATPPKPQIFFFFVCCTTQRAAAHAGPICLLEQQEDCVITWGKKHNSFHETVYVSLFLPSCKMVIRKPHPVYCSEKLGVREADMLSKWFSE